MKNCLFLITLILTLPFCLLAQEKSTKKEKPKPTINISALIHTDLIYDIKQMDPDWIGGFRPSKIPIYPEDPGWGTNGHTYFSLRQSTFKFNGYMPVNHRWGPVKVHFSFDLFGTGVNAGETTFRLRLVYGAWGPFIIGKNWSTFIDLNAFPGNWDWWGPSGMALLPDPMVRYTHKFNKNNILEVSIELPGSEIDAGQLRQIDPALLDVKSKEVLPDFITRYTRKGAWGYIKGALLLRQLSYEIVSTEFERAVSRSKFGWGVNLTSTIRVFKKQGSLKLQSVFGRGYAGYNNDGGVEIAPDETHRAVVPFQHGFVVAYDHFINDKWQVSVVYSETNQTNSAGQFYNAFHRSRYMVSQIIYQIIKDTFMVGLNYQYGMRINKNLDAADDHRIVFSARYQISWQN